MPSGWKKIMRKGCSFRKLEIIALHERQRESERGAQRKRETCQKHVNKISSAQKIFKSNFQNDNQLTSMNNPD